MPLNMVNSVSEYRLTGDVREGGKVNLTKQDLLISQETMKWCLNYVTPAYIADPPSQQNAGIYKNGTCSFIDTGMRMFAVTNWHVVEEFREQKLKKNDVIFQLGPIVYDIEERIIAEDKGRDLAIMEIGPDELKEMGKQASSCHAWPPERICKDERVVFAGYPGIFRETRQKSTAAFESVLRYELVKSASSEQFIIAFDMADLIELVGSREKSELTDFGGFSGTAVFRYKDDQPIAIIEPVGIVFEHGKMHETDIHLIRHIDFINADGTIR